MASKRSLYKPAPEESSAGAKHRRPLAQGRLATAEPAPAVPHVPQEQIAQAQTVGSRNTADLTRQALSYRQSGTDDTISREDMYSTPRRNPPRGSMSPARPKPTMTDELAVSDLESSSGGNGSTQSKDSAPVLYVDASRGPKSPENTEVDIVTSVVQSPIKVVCHTPAAIQSDLRNTGDPRQTAKVTVDAVPSVLLEGDTDHTMGLTDLQQSVPRHKMPLVIREKDIAGGAVDPYSSSRPVEIPEADTDEVPVRDSDSLSVRPKIRQQKQHDSVKDQGSSTAVSVTDSQREQPTKKKKKPKGIIVESRYMQKAKAAVLPDKPKIGKSTQSSAVQTPKPAPSRTTSTAKRKVAQSSSFSRDKSVRKESQHGSTPILAGNKRPTSTPVVAGSKRAASTPMGGTHPHTPGSMTLGDISAIPTADSILVAPSTATSASKGKPKKKASTEVTQHQLDMWYIRYLQWLYISSKMEKDLKEKEKQSSQYCYALWEKNEDLRKKITEGKQRIHCLKYQNLLDRMLKMQEAALQPLVDSAPKMQQDYSEFAHALDTTRHHLATISVSDDVDNEDYIKKLYESVNEIEQLLGQLSVMTSRQLPKVTKFSKELEELQKTTSAEGVLLKRMEELVAAAETIMTQEVSLISQEVQLNRAGESSSDLTSQGLL
ncbi:nucleolar protein dao-5-like isoform X1 [Branchiostoma floridae]|uniref:Nucleolar protein dao-5-like isoform X1 n=1 Tax=Branchiostoma floridae TaxID=7739 RepID=A0A9J7M4L6_BRAFL|nr:nucleolar protein dao-5-like isoform X1 [Branchiostoma floridae]